MVPTYPAILRDNHIEWTAGEPPAVGAGQELRVHVTLLDAIPASTPDQGARMVAALKKLAASGAFSEIADPVAWQREHRELPGQD